jgi:hypothetical protein
VSSPLIDWARMLPQRAIDTVTKPVTMLEEKFPGLADMLGMHQAPQQADPDMVKAANQSFVDAMNRKQQQPQQRGK